MIRDGSGAVQRVQMRMTPLLDPTPNRVAEGPFGTSMRATISAGIVLRIPTASRPWDTPSAEKSLTRIPSIYMRGSEEERNR